MKINEIEEQLQITRANVRFYEKEGLLYPKRNANGYRDYSEEDILLLKKIIIFRKLGISIADIKAVLDGTLSLTDAVEQNIENLKAQIDELNGALEVCKLIEKDPDAETDFDSERYWTLIHTKEENGQRFVELMKDYLEYEKHAFLSMWGGPFFYDLKGSVNRHGWLVACGILLIICIIRGLAVQFIWKTGSFLSGFSYPFLLFGAISIITFPLFALNRKYKDTDLSEEDMQMKSSKLITFLKVMAGILYLPLLLFGIPIFMEDLVYSRLLPISAPFIITSDLYILYFIVGLYVFAVFVWLYSKHGIFPNHIEKEEGFRAHLPRKVKRKTAICSVLIFFCTILIYLSWFDCFTTDGMTAQRLFYSKSYTWDDVDHYTLRADSEGTLKCTIVMKDGNHAICLGCGVSFSSLPENRYPDGEDDFVAELVTLFTKQGIPLELDSWEALKHDLTYDYWKEYTDRLRAIVEGQ